MVLAITAGQQDSGDFFGVVVVHLAAEGFEVERAALRRGGNEFGLGRCGGCASDERIQSDVERFLHITNFSLTQRPRRAGRMPALQMALRLARNPIGLRGETLRRDDSDGGRESLSIRAWGEAGTRTVSAERRFRRPRFRRA